MDNKKKWVEVSVNTSDAPAQAIENHIISLGSYGTVIEKPENREKLQLTHIVKGYFPGTLQETSAPLDALDLFLKAMSSIFPDSEAFEMQTKEICAEDWQKWRDFFKPVKVSRRIVIKPTWETYQKKGAQILVEIDPGMAFGTGTHETTRLCLQALDEYIIGDCDVLDVGCGSGVLAIAACGLAANEVVGIDNDEEAVKVATQNAAINHAAENTRFSSQPLYKLQRRFDLIVANILAETLIEMKEDLVNCVKEKGLIILSGILTSKEEMVINAYFQCGLTLKDIKRDGQWSAIIFTAPD